MIFPKKSVGARQDLQNNNAAAPESYIKNSTRLKKGGDLLIVPFRAGVGVAATEELDKISLTIVKGIAEALEKKDLPLKILSAANAETANLLMKGHVTQFVESCQAQKLLGKKSRILGVEGQIIDRDTGEMLLHFSWEISQKNKNEDYSSMAYGLGEAIAGIVAEAFGADRKE